MTLDANGEKSSRATSVDLLGTVGRSGRANELFGGNSRDSTHHSLRKWHTT